MNDTIRVIIIDVSKTLGAKIYDEKIVSSNEAVNFVNKYTDMTKYRIITV